MTSQDDEASAARPRRGRRNRDESRSEKRAAASTSVEGGKLAPMSADDQAFIHDAVIEILETVGMSEAPAVVVTRVTKAGGVLDDGERLLFPRALVEQVLDGLPRSLTLCGQTPDHDLDLSGANVHVGTGGAAPFIIDLETSAYRPSNLRDLYDAARLTDTLDHVQFFSRPLVARDIAEVAAMDVNTAYACLAGTTKHVLTSVTEAATVAKVADMGAVIAGSAEAFRERPFLSLNSNHVVPPLRFDAETCAVQAAAVRAGIPVHVNTFSQLGASSPVTIAGCLAQTMAETLAGMINLWLVDPGAKLIFGPRPMVTDLRTGAMAGGSGEQALLSAAATQMARFYGLPNSIIAGAADSKIPDAQAGYERCLAVTLAAQAGCNLVTQACGMHAGLMAVSFESYVIDNDMLGSILRSLSAIEVSAETISPARIGQAVRGEGHFLGEADTYARMETDFLYPTIADRRTPDEWQADGARDIRSVAHDRVRDILANHYPSHLAGAVDESLRARFDIRLPPTQMRPL